MISHVLPHYTSENQEAFIERVTSDFIGQIAQKLEQSNLSQSELAKRLNVTEPEVSQVLNLNRINLTLKTMARWAVALGLKVAVVVYDDNDAKNHRAPVSGDVFRRTWEKTGRPRDILSISQLSGATQAQISKGFNWTISWVNTTMAGVSTTTSEFSHIHNFRPLPSEKAIYDYARI